MNALISLQKEENGHYSLSGKLDRDTVPWFWQNRADWLPAEQSVVVSLSKLTRVDSAGMAMLLHWQQDTTFGQKNVAFTDLPLQLKTLMQLSNIQNMLNCL